MRNFKIAAKWDDWSHEKVDVLLIENVYIFMWKEDREKRSKNAGKSVSKDKFYMKC